jgi:hypothetical protein
MRWSEHAGFCSDDVNLNAAQLSVSLLLPPTVLRKARPRAAGFAHDAYFNHTDSTSRHHRHSIALYRTNSNGVWIILMSPWTGPAAPGDVLLERRTATQP